jgi:hypothetical protein
MLPARLYGLTATALIALTVAAPLAAQNTSTDSSKGPRSQPPAAQPPATQPAAPSPLNFSGVIFGSYNYMLPTTPGPLPNQTDNQFIIDRAYLTFRMPAGDKTSIRITTDIYQTTEATPNAYTIRAKYAYLQYDAAKFADGAALLGRIGILHNVLIDHEENFWPRYLSTVPTERAGFFSSADVGIATQYTMPDKWGEIYGTIVNGPGYTSRERDRFKDYALRLSLTPLATSTGNALLQAFTVTAWGYKGAVASSFVNGGAGQVGPVGEKLDRSRAGVLLGIREPRLSLAVQYALRHDEGETGANTAASPRVVTGTTGRLLSAYTVARPLAFTNGTGKSPFGIVARYDRVSPTASTDNITPTPPTSNTYHTIIGGVFFDLSQKAQIALDYQESLASNNGMSSAPPAQSKGYFAHFVVNF